MARFSITLDDFKKLLREDEFIDFFNKFTCLPAFAQLVGYSRKRKKYILHPPLPNHCTVNDSGLIEWLWRKRLNLFLMSRFFGEYRLCNCLIHHSLIKETGDALKTEKAREVQHALGWLQRKCLGRVSQIRKFRNFLNYTSDGSKLYQYWLDSEHLYFHVKLRSSVSMEVFNVIKEKHFVTIGESKIPQHLLNMARQSLREPYRSHDGDIDAKTCDVNFALYLRRLCADRLKNYWMPRYLLERNPVVEGDEETKFRDIAKKYLRGSINLVPEVFSPSESFKIEPEKKDLEKGNDRKERTFHENNCELKSQDKENQKTMNSGESSDEVGHATIFYGSNLSRRVIYVKYDNAAPDDDTLRVDRKTSRKEVYFSEPSSPGVSSPDSKYEEKSPDSFGDSSSEDEKEYRKRLKKRKARARERRAAGRKATGSIKTDDDPQKSPVAEYKKSDRSKTKFSIRNSTDKNERLSPGLSKTTEGREEVHDKYRQKKTGEMKFRFEDRKRRKSPHKRKLKFKELPTNQTHILPGMASNTGKLLKMPIKDADSQKIPLDDEEEDQGNSFDADRSLPNFSLSPHDMNVDAAGGKTLLKATLKLPTPPSRMSFHSLDSERPELSSRMSLISKFGRQRVSGPKPAFGQNSTSSTTGTRSSAKKMRVPVKRKRRKTKTTSFRLSDGAELPNQSPQKKSVKSDKKDSKPAEKPKKRPHLKKFSLPAITLPEAFSNEYSLDKDNTYRSRPENKRMILALRSDECASQPFRTFLLSTDSAEFVSYLGFWQDVEKTRQDFHFGTMTFSSFVLSIHGIVNQYLLSSSPCRFDASETLREEAIMNSLSPTMREMPWQIRKLQREVMEDLKYAHETFCQHETQSFLNAASFRNVDAKANSVVKKRECFLPPIIISKKTPDAGIPRVDDVYKTDLESRMYRSLRYVMEINLPDGRDSNPTEEISDESDDDGSVHVPPPPTYVRESSPDFKELASRSIKQYPSLAKTREIQKALKIFLEPTTPSPTLHNSVRRGGMILKRPFGRPKNFQEVLRNGIHFQFFKRFLKSHRANVPLGFWHAVETMRSAETVRIRQLKAKHIIQKFFHNPNAPAPKFLQCNSDMIKEIPCLKVVTTSNLYIAQGIIASMLEERWFKRYAETFEETTTPRDIETRDTSLRRSSLSRSRRLKKMWLALTAFIRRCASFLRSMRNPHLFDMFKEFLQKEKDNESSCRDSAHPLDFSANASESTNRPNAKHQHEVESCRVTQKIINGQVVVFNLLSNDLHFWRDIECFRAMTNGMVFEENSIDRYEEEVATLREKAELIVSCYLESDIQPSLRVNVPPDVADTTVESLRNGLVDKSLFHEATIYIFPLLIYFWKRFCDGYYRYVPTLSKKHKLIYGMKMTPAIAQKLKNQKKGINASQRHGDAIPANKKTKKNPYRVDTVDLPDYLRIHDNNITKKLLSPSENHETSARLTFSILAGVTLIEPAKSKKRPPLKIGAGVMQSKFI